MRTRPIVRARTISSSLRAARAHLVRYNLAVNIIDGAVAGDETAINVMEELLQLSQGEHREELLAVGKIVDKYKKARAHTR